MKEGSSAWCRQLCFIYAIMRRFSRASNKAEETAKTFTYTTSLSKEELKNIILWRSSISELNKWIQSPWSLEISFCLCFSAHCSTFYFICHFPLRAAVPGDVSTAFDFCFRQRANKMCCAVVSSEDESSLLSFIYLLGAHSDSTKFFI